MGKVKKGVKKFQKKIAGGGVHKKKKLHFRRDKAEAAKAAEAVEATAANPAASGVAQVRRCRQDIEATVSSTPLSSSISACLYCKPSLLEL